ncbi:hypothetical protein HanIR_Chr12g0579071 [Helianthus annuus]|nr:hypothetical protein HanIR_Chr12g0579071 [Helianthus annuus]
MLSTELEKVQKEYYTTDIMTFHKNHRKYHFLCPSTLIYIFVFK